MRGTWQSIAQVEEAHRQTGISWRGAGDQPRVPLQVRVLEHQVKSAPLRISRQRSVRAEGDLLDSPVLPVVCYGAVSDQRRAIGVASHAFADVHTAIITINQSFAQDCLKPAYGRSGMDQAHGSVSANQEVRSLAEDVASAAVAPEGVDENPQVLESLEVEVEKAAAARFRGRLEGWSAHRIGDLVRDFDAAQLQMELLARIEGQLGDYVGVQ